MTTQFPTQKQLDLIAKVAPQLTALGITQEEALTDSWRFQVIGRVLEPKEATLGAIKALNGRPMYKRSNREAEMQLNALMALQALMAGDSQKATDILKKEFMARPKVAA